MSSQPAAGDKRRTLNAPDTDDDDDGCAEQGEGAEAAGPNPEQAGTRNKKLRRDGEARNLSQDIKLYLLLVNGRTEEINIQ